MNHAIDCRQLRSNSEPWDSARATLRAGLLIGLLFAMGAPSAAVAQSPADRFVQSLESFENVPADARALIHKAWFECDDCDGSEFLTQGLTVLSGKFRDGLDAYDADDYERAATLMSDVAAGENMFFSVNAAVYEIKSLVQLDRLVEAVDRIILLTAGEDSAVDTYSYFAGEIEFLHGFCLLSDLQYEDAARVLGGFLRNHDDASQRLVIAAQQMLAELGNREAGKIGEVVDLMKFCGRRLYHSDGSEVVQTRQQRVIDILDRLIEEAEEQEKNSCKSGSAAGGGGQSPNNPLQQSQLPGGEASEGALRAGRRANPAEVWGSMPPAQRERVLQALREGFPSRYRRLVEQYYEELAKKP